MRSKKVAGQSASSSERFPRCDGGASGIEVLLAPPAILTCAERRRREIEEFWRWAPEWMEVTGGSEDELLRRFPSYRGTRPSRRNASAA
jgi:hypothetical protein